MGPGDESNVTTHVSGTMISLLALDDIAFRLRYSSSIATGIISLLPLVPLIQPVFQSLYIIICQVDVSCMYCVIRV